MPFITPIMLPKQSSTRHTETQHTNAQHSESKPANAMVSQTDTTAENPFTDPENRLRRSTDASTIEIILRAGRKSADDPHEYLLTRDHKPCSCSSFCRFLARATHDGHIATDLKTIEKLIERNGYKKGYSKGYDKGRSDSEDMSDATIQEAVDLGREQATEFMFAERKRQRAAWKEEMKHLEKRDIDAEDRDWAEYLASLDEPAKLTVWARKAKAAVKAKMGKGKGEGTVVGEGEKVE